jgi:hypothetical protein
MTSFKLVLVLLLKIVEIIKEYKKILKIFEKIIYKVIYY